MLRLPLFAAAALAAIALGVAACNEPAQTGAGDAAGGDGIGAVANVAGSYSCQAEADGCEWSGQTFTVTQTGNTLEVTNDKNEMGAGTVTSNITISMGPPWNMLGVISDNGLQIEWSNGTQWVKQ